MWIPNKTGKRFEAVRITPVKVVPGGMTTLLRQKLHRGSVSFSFVLHFAATMARQSGFNKLEE